MAWFRRRETQDKPAEVSTDTDAGDVARQEGVATGDWMTVPRIPTTIGQMAPTFRVQTLPEILTSHHDSRLSSSLGHSVSADAPSGQVHGLASTVSNVSPTLGHGELTLRSPAHAPAPEQDAPLVSRRLDVASSVGASTVAASPAANLPDPAVSRVLRNPAPMPSFTADSRPLPVARVVDTHTSSPTPTPAPSPAAAATSPEPAEHPAAPLVGDHVDDRVGGFEASFEDLARLASEPEGLRAPPPPAELLAPPLQPRSIQRRAQSHAAPAATPPSLPTATPSEQAPTSASPEAESGPANSNPAAAGAVAPLVGEAAASQTLGRALEEAGASGGVEHSGRSSQSELELRAPVAREPMGASTDDVVVARKADTPSNPLANPLVGDAPTIAASNATPGSQDADAAAGATASASGAGNMPLHSVARASDGGSQPDLAPPIQRLADASPAVASAPRGDASSSTTPATEDAPLLGEDAPLVSSVSDSSGGDAAGPGPGDEAMPLTAPLSGPPTTAPASGDSHAPAVDSSSGDAAASDELAPTLSADEVLTVQSLSETGVSTTTFAPAANVAGLPLAPVEQVGTLGAPHSGAGPTTNPAGPLSRLADTRSQTSASSTSSILRAPVQRSVEAAPTGASGAQRATAARMDLVRPLAGSATIGAAAAVGLERSAESTSGSLSTSSAHVHPAAPATSMALAEPVAMRRLNPTGDFGTTTDAHGADSFELQRSTGAPSTSSAALPLHTPAASVPSAADIAVKAGLAERQADGSLLYTTQRMSEASSGGSFDTVQRSQPAEVFTQRALAEAPSAPVEAAPSGGAAAGASAPDDLDRMARKLYKRLRSEMQADLRRQLEARNRAGRFRT